MFIISSPNNSLLSGSCMFLILRIFGSMVLQIQSCLYWTMAEFIYANMVNASVLFVFRSEIILREDSRVVFIADLSLSLQVRFIFITFCSISATEGAAVDKKPL